MASKLLLVVGKKDSFRIQYLKDLLATSYEMLHVESFDAFSNSLEERYYDYISVIIDNPSKFEKAEDYISLVSKKNSYMLCLPVLMLTDDENIAEDGIKRVKKLMENEKKLDKIQRKRSK